MQPQVVEFDIEQLESKLDQIERTLGEETSRPFRLLVGSYASLLKLLQEKNLSVGRLRRLLFGARTERTRDLETAETPTTETPGAETPGAEAPAGQSTSSLEHG